MNEHCIKATIREHGLVKLVMSKLRLDQNYQMNIEELVAMNAVKLEEHWKELHNPAESKTPNPQ